MKIFFGIILAIIFLISFLFILFTENPNAGIIAFTPVSFIIFVVYFGHVFLNFEISSKTISIQKRVNNLEINHKELMHIVTALYKLSYLNFSSHIINEISEDHISQYITISEELRGYINQKDVDLFSDLLVKIQAEQQ